MALKFIHSDSITEFCSHSFIFSHWSWFKNVFFPLFYSSFTQFTCSGKNQPPNTKEVSLFLDEGSGIHIQYVGNLTKP